MSGVLSALAPWIVLPAVLAIAVETARASLPALSAFAALLLDAVAVLGEVYPLLAGVLLALPLLAGLAVRHGRGVRSAQAAAMRRTGRADRPASPTTPPRGRRAA